MSVDNRFIILTGGPGSGKTTLLEKFVDMGYSTRPETGRQIIQEQMKFNGEAVPWNNPEKFAELMLARDIEVYDQIKNKAELTFFDRGVLDVLSYLNLISSVSSDFESLKQRIKTAAKKREYANLVFIAAPWRDIYAHDAERKQTWQEACKTYEMVRSVYLEYGYTLMELPKTSVEDRAQFVLDQLKKISFL